MKTLTLKLENCYGIRKLEKTLDFSKSKAIAIYAPNGSLKTSLAQTFQDIADGTVSRDRIFPDRVCTREIRDENGTEIPKEGVLVVKPYEEPLEESEKTSTLLVNAKLRKEYEDLHAEINAAKAAFLKALKEQSGSKRYLEKEVSLAFTAEEGNFFVALDRIKGEVSSRSDAPLKDIPFDIVFDEKIQGFLETQDFKTAIAAYIQKYNELLAASTYFKKGVFNYYNATQIAKQLADNGFFAAKHSVNLNADQKKEITTQKELEALIVSEKEAISNNKDLRKKFSEIEKLIQKNVAVREFEAFLLNHEELLSKFENMAEFRQEVLKAYIDTKFDFYQTLVEKHTGAEVRRKAIQTQAETERTQWEEVIDIFNSRFAVPFKLQAANRMDVVLGQQPTLKLEYLFSDDTDQKILERSTLLQSLSTGEKKALYVLNILFEIEVRKKAAQETLIIVDDIADSFDYKNKYAIIQYLMDVSEDRHFQQIILTHNFDFFRTIESRFVRTENCLMAFKTGNGLALEAATELRNVFKDWKSSYYSDPKKKIASIPFIRNLIEYTRGSKDKDYLKLTSLLHWKPGSDQITVSDLDEIYNQVFSANGTSSNNSGSVVALIAQEAEGCLNAPDGINFANKVVLAIATRLAAEQFMVNQIDDKIFVDGIQANQTAKLLKRFQRAFPNEREALSVLRRVVLMTPENIHLNSFMYEPILDMSDNHLRALYTDATNLRDRDQV